MNVVGGDGGNSYNDDKFSGICANKITQLSVRSSRYVDKIYITYLDTTKEHGKNGGSFH